MSSRKLHTRSRINRNHHRSRRAAGSRKPSETSPSFAERVGQKKRVSAPDPFGIATDYLAGVRLFESKQDRQMAIKFGEGRPEDKPSQAVIDTMKEAGYRWNPSDRIWAHPVRSESAMSTRIEAERLYQDVRQMIRQEKGIEAGPEIPLTRCRGAVPCPSRQPIIFTTLAPRPRRCPGIAITSVWR